MTHSIHCSAYRGVGRAFDELKCDCNTSKVWHVPAEVAAAIARCHGGDIEEYCLAAKTVFDRFGIEHLQRPSTGKVSSDVVAAEIAQLSLERDACADAMEQEHVRCLALEAALRLIATHQNADIAKLALNPRMACRRCGAAPECDVAFDRYNCGTEPKVDCLATK